MVVVDCFLSQVGEHFTSEELQTNTAENVHWHSTKVRSYTSHVANYRFFTAWFNMIDISQRDNMLHHNLYTVGRFAAY